MSNLRVYKYTNEEEEYEYILTSLEFSEKNLCEVYDRYGQQSNCTDAGCYSLQNYYVKEDFISMKQDILLELLAKKFKEHEMSEHETLEDYKYEDEDLYDVVIQKEFEKDGAEQHTQARYETYWDGHNYKSILLYADLPDFQPDVEEIDEDLEKEILADLEIAEVISENPYSKILNGKKYEFFKSYMQDAWETYVATKLND